jgi:hypothetical protein
MIMDHGYNVYTVITTQNELLGFVLHVILGEFHVYAEHLFGFHGYDEQYCYI